MQFVIVVNSFMNDDIKVPWVTCDMVWREVLVNIHKNVLQF